MTPRKRGSQRALLLLAAALLTAAPLIIISCTRPQTTPPAVAPPSPPTIQPSPTSQRAMPWPQRNFPAATVTVDGKREQGVLNNPGWYLNQSNPIHPSASEELRRVSELNARVIRAWIKPDRYFDTVSRAYSFDYGWGGTQTLHQYLDQVSTLATELMINLDQCAPEFMEWRNPHQCRDIMKAGLLHYKSRYPKIRYVEVFNEPDKIWTPQAHERPAVPLNDYYEWYKVAYQVVAEVNATVQSGPPLLIGGPVAYTFNRDFLQQFLDKFTADSHPTKRLDFLSYHQYRARENPASVRDEKLRVREWLSKRSLPATIPIYVTEYGVFPGDNGTDNAAADGLTHAAAMASLGMFYIAGGIDMPMHWVVQHSSNDRKSMVVPNADGAVYPYYNLVRLQSMLKKVQLEAKSDRLTEAGLGVNALATRDRSGVAVLLTNYQWTTGTQGYDITVHFRDLPDEYQSGPLTVSTYLVDSSASNYLTGAGSGELEVYEHTIPSTSGPNLNVTISMERNAIALVVVSPA